MAIVENGTFDAGKEVTHLAVGRFVTSLHAIANGPFRDSSADAQIFFHYFANDQGRAFNTGRLPSTSMASDIEFFASSGLPTGREDRKIFASSYYPVPRLSLNTMSFAVDAHVEADLARTASVFRQFLTRDHLLYSSRLRTVYQRGIQKQTAWLEHRQAAITEGDPRVTPKEAVLKEILGEDRYLLDIGFSDWQKAIDIWMNAHSPQSIRDSIMEELDKAKEAGSNIPGEDYSHDSLRDTLAGFGEVIEKAHEQVEDSAAITKLLRSLRKSRDGFVFERENFLNEYSMKRLGVNRILGTPECLEGLRRSGSNARAGIVAHILIIDRVEDLLDARKERREERVLVAS